MKTRDLINTRTCGYISTSILLHNATIKRDFDLMEDIFSNRGVTVGTIEACKKTLYMEDWYKLAIQFNVYRDSLEA